MTYHATRHVSRFYEYIDGQDPATPGGAFNIDAEPYEYFTERREFDTAAELIDAIRRDGVTFYAYGSSDRATDPDGSQIIDYATAARETVTWDLDGINPRLLDRVIIPAVDGTCDRAIFDGNRDYASFAYCGLPRGHAGEHGDWAF